MKPAKNIDENVITTSWITITFLVGFMVATSAITPIAAITIEGLLITSLACVIAVSFGLITLIDRLIGLYLISFTLDNKHMPFKTPVLKRLNQ